MKKILHIEKPITVLCLSIAILQSIKNIQKILKFSRQNAWGGAGIITYKKI